MHVPHASRITVPNADSTKLPVYIQFLDCLGRHNLAESSQQSYYILFSFLGAQRGHFKEDGGQQSMPKVVLPGSWWSSELRLPNVVTPVVGSQGTCHAVAKPDYPSCKATPS